MEPTVVDLPPLDRLRDRWAAAAAVLTALGLPDAAHARDGVWRWDAGDTWADVALLGPDRALLYGWDPAVPTRLSRRPDGTPTGELLTEAPDWWSVPLRAVTAEVGFVLGWDGAAWSRVPADLVGPALAGLPVDAEALYAVVDSAVEGAADDQGQGDFRPPWPAVAAMGSAGPDLTGTQLADVLGPLRADLAGGVAAAQLFRSPVAG